jgi:hypothetical protein
MEQLVSCSSFDLALAVLISCWLLWQGWQMVCLKTKNPILRKFFRVYVRWENVDNFYGHLENVIDICCDICDHWHIVCSFGTFFPVLVSCTKKNLATLCFCFMVYVITKGK